MRFAWIDFNNRTRLLQILTVFVLGLAALIVKDSITLSHYFLLPAALGFGLFLIQSKASPQVVTFFLIAYLPFSKLLFGEEEITSSTAITNFLIALASYFYALWDGWRRGRRVRYFERSPLNKSILILLSLIFLSLGSVVLYGRAYLWESLTYFLQGWVTPILVFFLILKTVKTREALFQLAILLAVVLAVIGFMSNYEYYDRGVRILGIAGEPNFSAAFFNLCMLIPLSYFLLRPKSFGGWLMLALFLLCGRVLMITFSRGGYLSLALGLAVITLIKSKRLFILLALGLGFVFVMPKLLPEQINARLASTFRTESFNPSALVSGSVSLDRSSADRIHVWRGAWRLASRNPFLGIGYHAFESRVVPYWAGIRRFSAHNGFLQMAAEVGFPALIIYLWMLFIIFRHSLWTFMNHSEAVFSAFGLGLTGGLGAFLLSNLFISAFDWHETAFLLWLLTAFVMRCSRLRGALS